MMTNAEILAVVQAAEEGKEIEFCRAGEWLTVGGEPVWNFAIYEYRIKPPTEKIVKSLAWRNIREGQIYWCDQNALLKVLPGWERFPVADFEGEVEE